MVVGDGWWSLVMVGRGCGAKLSTTNVETLSSVVETKDGVFANY